ncbi:MAG: D-alanine--D-alanine ligase [Chloroflexota bacterium]|jgi:D-alanine-D-alanine ligase
MKIKVGVLFGGRSGEHEVSLASATSIIKNLDRSKYEVIPIGITKEGRWLLEGNPLQALQSGLTNNSLEPVLLTSANTSSAPLAVASSPPRSNNRLTVDVVFPVLHGPYGEDGTVQGLLEMAGVPYVGAGVLASSVGMDKAIMKVLFKERGLPIVKHVVVARKDWENEPEVSMDFVEKSLGYPCFVKPANLGSSVGISKASNRSSLSRAIAEAAKYDRKIVVEEGIQCREIECSVLGNDDPIASVPGEIIPCNEFYDYRAKYLDEGSELLIPAPIPSETAEEIRHLAVEAFRAIDCSGMARVDFFLEKQSSKVYLNEVNTIPGFTKISMYPKLWEASGLPYPQLIDRLIELALERHADRMRCATSYQPE